jgi:hypothetical protein
MYLGAIRVLTIRWYKTQQMLTTGLQGKLHQPTRHHFQLPPQPSLILSPSPHLKNNSVPALKRRQCTPGRVARPGLRRHGITIPRPINSSQLLHPCHNLHHIAAEGLQEPARLSLACKTPSLSSAFHQQRPQRRSPQCRRRAWAATPTLLRLACDGCPILLPSLLESRQVQ